MASDLSRFLRAVKVLARLAHKYDHDTWTEALGRYATTQQEDDVWFVGTVLDEIGHELSRRRDETETRCCECGKIIADIKDRDARTDARYCSAKCRQKAYRKRVTASKPKPRDKCNGIAASLRLAGAERNLPVTGGAP